MRAPDYLTILFAFGLVVGVYCDKLISTSSRPSDINLDRDYFQGGTAVKSAVYIEGSRNHLKVIVTSYYHNLIRRRCVKQVKFRLVMDGKELEPLDSFLISCETNTPSTTTRNWLEIGNVAQLMVLGGVPMTGGVWAVFKVDTGGCLQKRYTDNQWRKLEEPEEMTLTEEQCQKVMKDGMPKTQMVQTLPEVGAAMMGKVIWLGETPSGDYSQYTEEWSKEVRGAVVKVTVKKQTNSATKDCALLVLLEAETWDDDLGSARLSCVDPPLFTRDKGMISLNGLMYLRDQPGEATWAVFVKDDHCVLRVFTDKDQEIVEVDDKKLDWQQCKQAVATQSIDDQSGPVPSTEIERTTQVKILSVKEECDYQEEYVEVGTDTTALFMAKVVVHRLLNKECLTQVNIYSVEYVSNREGRRSLVEKDFLDCIQISCSPQRHVNTMIELNRINVGNRVYVLTKLDQPMIYAVLVREGSCVLRKYTDEKMQLVGKEDRPLTWDECMEVIDKQRVDWLPEVPAPTVPSTPVPTPRMVEAAIQRAKTNVANILELINSQVPFYTQAIKDFAATRFQPIPRPEEPDNTKLTPQPITAPPVTGKRRWFSWLGL